ncbi:MAG: aminoacyl-tRNA hydrolase [Gammaproteobacteria bacterium]|nr:aminoacyl-tRNA hydrolase [Gammaproteobacteria bacterium]
MIQVTGDIELAEEELQFRFVLASGPGGQNVNKVASAAQLRFDTASAALPDPVRARLRALAGRRLTREGEIVITAKSYRTRERNRHDAIERLLSLIRQAARPPRTRKKTRPPRASKERRLQEKRTRSRRLDARRTPND